MTLGIPQGWFVVGQGSDLPRRGVRPVELAGERRVLWRGVDGVPRLHGAYCPHLGADLTEGGCVTDQGLRCPFHGFVFAGDGACVATGYDTKPPPTARLSPAPVVERHGLLFAWIGGDAPGFALEVDAPPGDWSPFRTRHFELDSHPQEISENSVDVGHFAWVHGYERFREIEPAVADGPELRARYGFLRPLLGPVQFDTEIAVRVLGLGYSHVHVTDATTGLQLQLLVLPTPLDARRVRLTLGLSVHRPRGVPRFLARRVLSRLALRVYARDVQQDFQVWSTKRWVERPALAKGDGPIPLYRRWATQFYPEPG